MENQVRCMFLLEQKNSSKPLNVNSLPASPSTSSLSASAAASPVAAPPEIKQKTPFNRTDKRRFSFFQRRGNKDTA